MLQPIVPEQPPEPLHTSFVLQAFPSLHAVPTALLDQELVLLEVLQTWQGLPGFCCPFV